MPISEKNTLDRRAASLDICGHGPADPVTAGIDATSWMSRRESWICTPETSATSGSPR